MEALLINLEDENSMCKAKHSPISVCITSNVPGFEGTKFILDPNLDNLLKEMVEYITAASDKAYEMAQERWRFVFEELTSLEQQEGHDGPGSLT